MSEHKGRVCEGCAESTDDTYDGGYCEDCAIDNLEIGSGTRVQPDTTRD